MNILAFDTCLDKMYVALSENNNILASRIVETTQSHYHSAFLISTIKDILKEAGLTPQDIGVIATNIGPGSFTGIRACTTVARVFAQGNKIKTIGVSSLEILSKITSEEKKEESETEEWRYRYIEVRNDESLKLYEGIFGRSYEGDKFYHLENGSLLIVMRMFMEIDIDIDDLLKGIIEIINRKEK